jgi:enediyne biosynthesis protein E4
VLVGGGHAGGQLGSIHIGLGDSDAAELRVVWPDGVAGARQRLEADGFYVVDRDAPARSAPMPVQR